ncbi:hypothetical protein [Leptothoe sp. PORK10 BA2]|uniref:hypothetical protein n=1 Tax=Leptothoe sp. PORK10 BA2 TaxID=3110254 RepID=UPI002B208D4D|nr:hypothetical protein [Leptothoe sp. PORK10 BA2]MEA5465813.1 hypothetical protein [Leptothoe sp. PORK10 BA2]
MYSLETFTKADLYHCSIALRNVEHQSHTMEQAANRMVRYFYENFLTPRTGQRELALVRFFKTHPYQDLNRRLQAEAQAMVPGRYISPSTRCLLLLATMGDDPHWNVRQESRHHQAIPLIDPEFVQGAPMIAQMIQQFGLPITTVLKSNTSVAGGPPQRAFNVFHIPTVLKSPYIPAQKEFVEPYRLKSVVGFGGMLPSNEWFAVILFSKTFIGVEIANHFRLMSAYVGMAIGSFQGDAILSSEILV